MVVIILLDLDPLESVSIFHRITEHMNLHRTQKLLLAGLPKTNPSD